MYSRKFTDNFINNSKTFKQPGSIRNLLIRKHTYNESKISTTKPKVKEEIDLSVESYIFSSDGSSFKR